MFEINLNNKTALIFGFSNHRSIAWHTANKLHKSGAKIIYEVGASAESDMYFGEMGIKCSGTVSISTPDAGSVTLIVG